jgi:hypothetical protein
MQMDITFRERTHLADKKAILSQSNTECGSHSVYLTFFV